MACCFLSIFILFTPSLSAARGREGAPLAAKEASVAVAEALLGTSVAHVEQAAAACPDRPSPHDKAAPEGLLAELPDGKFCLIEICPEWPARINCFYPPRRTRE